MAENVTVLIWVRNVKQMGTGANGHLWQDSYLGKWALEENGHQEKWAKLRAVGHRGKWAFEALNWESGLFWADGHLGKMRTRKNEHQGK